MFPFPFHDTLAIIPNRASPVTPPPPPQFLRLPCSVLPLPVYVTLAPPHASPYHPSSATADMWTGKTCMLPFT